MNKKYVKMPNESLEKLLKSVYQSGYTDGMMSDVPDATISDAEDKAWETSFVRTRVPDILVASESD